MNPEEILNIEQLAAAYGKNFAIKKLALTVSTGEFWGVLGLNGSGKTTLLKCILKLHPRANMLGNLNLFGKPLTHFSRQALARTVAYVPQVSAPITGFTVQETIELGRLPHLRPFQPLSKKEQGLLTEAMQQTQVMQLKNRYLSELSGGEYQRVLIARALVQQPQLLLLDEPTAHFDFGAQYDILYLLRALLKQAHLYFSLQAIIATFHDVVLAGRFCSHLLLLREGEVIAAGPRNEVLTEENIFKTYGLPVTLHTSEQEGLIGLTPK